jgi:hypothetical protein
VARGDVTERELLMSENETAQQEEPKDKRAPIIIAIFAFIVFAFATAINYGGLFHHAVASETVAPVDSTK